MYGLQKYSELKEIIVKKDKNTAIQYRVVEKKINVGVLKAELAELQAINDKVAELEEFRKTLPVDKQEFLVNLPTQDTSILEARIAELENL